MRINGGVAFSHLPGGEFAAIRRPIGMPDLLKRRLRRDRALCHFGDDLRRLEGATIRRTEELAFESDSRQMLAQPCGLPAAKGRQYPVAAGVLPVGSAHALEYRLSVPGHVDDDGVSLLSGFTTRGSSISALLEAESLTQPVRGSLTKFSTWWPRPLR